MRSIRIGLVAVIAAVVMAASTAAAQAAPHPSPSPGTARAVFVQTDGLGGNQVVSYDRAGDGTLSLAHTYDTGGLGGQLAGSMVDHLASQGSLTADRATRSLYAVNAGSDTVTVFGVHGDRLVRRQVVGSGGRFPVSVATRGNLVYVLNALDGGSVQGFVDLFGHLVPIPGSHRGLGLDPTAAPQFVNTPGQVAFSPDGRQLIVTTKANGNDIDVFRIGIFGSLSAPTVNAEPATVPFAISYDADGHLIVAEAGTNALASFALHRDGTVTPIQSVATGQTATCWVATTGGRFYASNAGSGTLSRFTSTGGLTLVGTTPTDGGTVDATVAPNGHFLYVQTGGAGIVDEFRIQGNGSLVAIGSVTVAGAVGGEGIIAL